MEPSQGGHSLRAIPKGGNFSLSFSPSPSVPLPLAFFITFSKEDKEDLGSSLFSSSLLFFPSSLLFSATSFLLAFFFHTDETFSLPFQSSLVVASPFPARLFTTECSMEELEAVLRKQVISVSAREMQGYRLARELRREGIPFRSYENSMSTSIPFLQ